MTVQDVELYARLLTEALAVPYAIYRLCQLEKNTRKRRD